MVSVRPRAAFYPAQSRKCIFRHAYCCFRIIVIGPVLVLAQVLAPPPSHVPLGDWFGGVVVAVLVVLILGVVGLLAAFLGNIPVIGWLLAIMSVIPHITAIAMAGFIGLGANELTHSAALSWVVIVVTFFGSELSKGWIYELLQPNVDVESDGLSAKYLVSSVSGSILGGLGGVAVTLVWYFYLDS